MAKVFLHTTDSLDAEYPDWLNQEIEFSRIPVVGEYVCLSTDGSYYKVQAVIHTVSRDPSEFDGLDAEVYATLDELSEQGALVSHVYSLARKPIQPYGPD